jgi:hypothetical protein
MRLEEDVASLRAMCGSKCEIPMLTTPSWREYTCWKRRREPREERNAVATNFRRECPLMPQTSIASEKKSYPETAPSTAYCSLPLDLAK